MRPQCGKFPYCVFFVRGILEPVDEYSEGLVERKKKDCDGKSEGGSLFYLYCCARHGRTVPKWSVRVECDSLDRSDRRRGERVLRNASRHPSYVLNDEHVEAVDVSKPILQAEVTPGVYLTIDGNHRVEKARRQGHHYLDAYRLRVEQHIPYMTSIRSYLTFVEYWNTKLSNRHRRRSRL